LTSTVTSAQSRSASETAFDTPARSNDAEQLEVMAQTLSPNDQVAMAATSNDLAIARILEPHVQRVLVATRRDLGGRAG
jgi:hypothetical protein